MKIWLALIAVLALAAIAFFGAADATARVAFGIVFPYIAIAVFLAGFIHRVFRWASSPVPFRIVTTTGQQKSLPWIKASVLESPWNNAGVILRMAFEILFFRSLFRGAKADIKGNRLIYGEHKYLWLAALVFHWSMLTVFLRHMRFFAEPVPFFVPYVQAVDGFFQVGVPALYLTSLGLLAAVTYLFIRRVVVPQVRYIGLPSDYFPLFLIGAIAVTGVLMRHFYKVDLVAVKELALGLASLNPQLPEGIGALFFVHLVLVSTLAAYFPFSKLMHMGGIFLTPTRNLANNSRMRRHVNPWNPAVNVHTYHEWEEEHRDVLVASGYTLDSDAK